jgi:hypothetical protein
MAFFSRYVMGFGSGISISKKRNNPCVSYADVISFFRTHLAHRLAHARWPAASGNTVVDDVSLPF